ncbi:transposase [Serpentinicella alkaliphila]|nr:transposase [Serpentinicella alkaliphila]
MVLDDTKVAHAHGKKIPFLCWLYDSSIKINIWCMNIVATTVVLKNGLKYPLFWRIWRKVENSDEKQTKIDLSKEMLMDIRRIYTGVLWVAMDPVFMQRLFNWLTDHQYDWVTKAKRNTALYRKEIENITGRERFIPVKPSMLIKEVFFKLLISSAKDKVSAISIPNIYIKLPYRLVGKQGKVVTKYRYTPIAKAVVATRLKEDTEMMKDEFEKNKEVAATYRGAYLLISNRVDNPEEALDAYIKRWSIEVFFRTAKQELGLNSCHSTSESHHYAHIELIFTAETLLVYARWELNNKGAEEGFTHGEMVRNFFNATYRIVIKAQQCFQTIQVHFDTEVRQFARLIDKFWPKNLLLGWFTVQNSQYMESTA